MYIKFAVIALATSCLCACDGGGVAGFGGRILAGEAGEEQEDAYERLLARMSCEELTVEELQVRTTRQTFYQAVTFDRNEKLDEIEEARIAADCAI